MIAANYTNFRDNMKSYFDKLSNDKDTMIITRKEENMYVVPESIFNSMQETLYLISSEENRKYLLKSLEQYNNKKVTSHELVNVND